MARDRQSRIQARKTAVEILTGRMKACEEVVNHFAETAEGDFQKIRDTEAAMVKAFDDELRKVKRALEQHEDAQTVQSSAVMGTIDQIRFEVDGFIDHLTFRQRLGWLLFGARWRKADA